VCLSVHLLRVQPTVGKSSLISIGVSVLGHAGIHSVDPRVKVNILLYRNLFSYIKQFSVLLVVLARNDDDE